MKLILPLSFGLFLFLSISLYLSMSPRLLLATVIEQIVVVVDGDPYTMTDLKDYVRTKSRRDFSTEELTQVSTKSKAVLEQFITEKLIAAEVDRLGIKVSEENINEYIEKVKRRTRISDAQLRAALRRDGVKMEQYRASIRAEIEKGELINRQVEKKVNIIPEDVDRYYQAHKKRFMTKGKVHLRHILIQIPEDATPEQGKAAFSRALKIRERALQGEDFSRLARKYSEGAGAPDGGDIGWVDRKSLLDEIAEVAFKSPPGEISLPVRTSLGVHLIKVEELQPAKLIPLSEVRTKIKKELFAKAMEERFQKWLKTDLRKRHRVDVKLPGFIFRAEKTKKRTIDSLL
ncbi:MAG: peptidylprolyl isomerase, partial [Deltaproteobacteria bacterium]|nr:peptidylprolyl isomerase [Deltaproteobacteria bacterium]